MSFCEELPGTRLKSANISHLVSFKPAGFQRSWRAAAMSIALAALAMAFGMATAAVSLAQEAFNLTGTWGLYHKDKKIEVARWVHKDPDGKEYGGREVRGPYKIVQPEAGVLVILHGNEVWAIGFPPFGQVIRAAVTAQGFDLGPILTGQKKQLEMRVRPGADELELWTITDVTDSSRMTLGELSTAPHELEYAFSGYVLVREGEPKVVPALPEGGIF